METLDWVTASVSWKWICPVSTLQGLQAQPLLVFCSLYYRLMAVNTNFILTTSTFLFQPRPLNWIRNQLISPTVYLSVSQTLQTWHIQSWTPDLFVQTCSTHSLSVDQAPNLGSPWTPFFFLYPTSNPKGNTFVSYIKNLSNLYKRLITSHYLLPGLLEKLSHWGNDFQTCLRGVYCQYSCKKHYLKPWVRTRQSSAQNTSVVPQQGPT